MISLESSITRTHVRQVAVGATTLHRPAQNLLLAPVASLSANKRLLLLVLAELQLQQAGRNRETVAAAAVVDVAAVTVLILPAPALAPVPSIRKRRSNKQSKLP